MMVMVMMMMILILAIVILPEVVALDIKIQEKQQDGPVKNRIKTPCSNPITPTFHKMKQENPNMADQIAPKKDDLAIQYERKTRARKSDRRPESIRVDDGAHERREYDRKHLK